MDGRAWWVHEASGADWTSDLRGKNISLVFTTLPITALVAVILAALSGGWSQLITVLVLAVAVCLVQLGIGNVVSLRAPWAVPASRTNAWAANTGQGCVAGLTGLLGLVALGVLSLPVAVAVLLVPSAVGRLAVAMVALAYGYGLWRLGMAVAVRRGEQHGPEVLATLSEGVGAT
jgi:ABC-2 type transport system permease protein